MIEYFEFISHFLIFQNREVENGESRKHKVRNILNNQKKGFTNLVFSNGNTTLRSITSSSD